MKLREYEKESKTLERRKINANKKAGKRPRKASSPDWKPITGNQLKT